ncbi:MAG: hypothetical protein NC930_01835 [Candidatus Omnitrophica bacterium]|nr:hypothetical protein [Candidatus Omnitrophota bacterium]
MKCAVLAKAYDLAHTSGIFYDQMTLEWTTNLIRLYERGWLYGVFSRDDLIAVAGAYRIKQWDEKYRYELPDQEEGNILYVSFFASESDDMSEPLKFLRHFLRENPDINELIYYKKNGAVRRRHFRLNHAIVKKEGHRGRHTDRRYCLLKERINIIPPDILPAANPYEVLRQRIKVMPPEEILEPVSLVS